MTTVPAIQRLGSGLIIQGPAVGDLAYLVELGLRYRAGANGAAPSVEHRRLLAVLRETADIAFTPDNASRGRRTSAKPADPEQLNAEGWVGSMTAAQLLNIGPRQVRRIAHELGGIRTHGKWSFSRSAVISAALRRKERNPE